MICANKDCAKEFDAKTHNQKYCSDECCRIATNKRIMEKYYEKKAIRGGAHRECKRCRAKLSRYNTSVFCAMCEKNSGLASILDLKRMINEVS